MNARDFDNLDNLLERWWPAVEPLLVVAIIILLIFSVTIDAYARGERRRPTARK